jgi:hypothetical protein
MTARHARSRTFVSSSILLSLTLCPLNTGETVGVCVATATGEAPIGAVFTPTNACLTTNDVYIRRCPIRADGTLAPCIDTTDSHFNSTYGITLQ